MSEKEKKTADIIQIERGKAIESLQALLDGLYCDDDTCLGHLACDARGILTQLEESAGVDRRNEPISKTDG